MTSVLKAFIHVLWTMVVPLHPPNPEFKPQSSPCLDLWTGSVKFRSMLSIGSDQARYKLRRTDKQIENEPKTILRGEVLAKVTKDDVPFKWIWNFLVLRSGSECYQKQETRVPAGGTATPGPCCWAAATHGGEHISLHHAFATVFVRWVFPFGFFRPDFPQHLELSRRRKVPVVIGDEGFSFSAWWGLNCEDLLQSF